MMVATEQQILAENEQLRGELAELRARLTEAEDTIVDLRRRETLDAVRESEQKLECMFRVAPALIAVYEGPEHVYRFSNILHDRLVHQRPLLGLPLREALPELAGQGIFERYDRAYASGELLVVPEFPARIDRTGDGVLEEGWFSQVLQPWFDAEGRVAGLLSLGFEITEQVRARAAAQQSEERLRLALDAGCMGTWTMDARTGEQTWDVGTSRIYCIGMDESLDYQRLRREVLHPDDRAYVDREVERALDPRGDGRYQAEYRVVWPDGSVHWVLCRGRVVFAGEGAERTPVRLLGTAVEVTERREMERALRESEERFRTLADNIAQLAWMADSAGTIFWYNERWLQYTGRNAAEMLSWGCRSLHHPEHADRVVEKLERCFESGTVWEDTFPLRGKDGDYRWFLCRAIPIRDQGGKVLRWFGTNTDVTAQREVEQALMEAHRRKDEFLAMLAHELRNPLAPIRTALEVMNMVGADLARARQMRDMIERQVAHMARLIDDLLDVSRIARGKVQLRMERCDLVAIARSVTDDYQPIFAAGGLRMGVALPAGPLWLQGDATRLAQVLGNLLSNASKFTPPGGHVEVAMEAERAADQAVLTVRDTGVGIAPTMLEHVFEPFTQADLGLDRSKGGLGLGLPLVRGLIALHGGTVTAHSGGIGQGATFVVQLPLAPGPPAAPARASSACAPGGGLRILIIEDNRDTADSMQELLTLLGHEAAVAYAGPTGLELAPRFRPDVVLCDIGLPGLDGFEVARALRRDPATRHAYLIAQTGYGQEEDRRRTREAGFDHHLRKPVELDELRRILAAVARS